MNSMKCSLGLDFGTNSARCLIVRTDGRGEIASATVDYPSGEQGILLSASDPNLARQRPEDYLVSLEQATHKAIAQGKAAHPDFDPTNVIGIGVDTTGSSPMPVTANNEALASDPDWRENLQAQCWLWKDHTSHAEAAKITEIATGARPQYLAKCGNTYSSEWWWSKIWHCLNVAPEVFEAAYSWVEIADWIPAQLTGVSDPRAIKRGVCAAGHKALYADDWGGLPDKEFLAMLSPELADLRDRLYQKAYDASETAGRLSSEWAERLGLPSGIPIAIGEVDVHFGAIGCGVDDGVLVKAIGTSSCDCTVASSDKNVPDVPGICGIVKGSILPGRLGIEAGQSAVGDIFKWWAEVVCQGDASLHAELEAEVAQHKAGQSGLLALDWNNGNRTVLVDPLLSGLLLGQSLHTTRAEIYRALIEATAYGARAIVERLEEYGVKVDRIVCCGGIAEKNATLMQIYADVLGREMQLAASSQACALGAAIGGAVVAGARAGGFDCYEDAQAVMTGVKGVNYQPRPAERAVYDELYKLYRDLHDAFGGVKQSANLSSVMKDLIRIRDRQRKG